MLNDFTQTDTKTISTYFLFNTLIESEVIRKHKGQFWAQGKPTTEISLWNNSVEIRPP